MIFGGIGEVWWLATPSTDQNSGDLSYIIGDYDYTTQVHRYYSRPL